MKKLTYPRISPQLDRRRKLTAPQIAEIQDLREQGWTYKRLAEEFRVVKSSIMQLFWTERQRELSRIRHRRASTRRRSTPEGRARNKELMKQHYHARRKRLEFMAYFKEYQKQYRLAHGKKPRILNNASIS